MKSALLKKPVVHIFLIAVLILIAYSNTFDVPFHFDDKPNIVKNPLIKNLDFFTNPSKAEAFRDTLQYNAYTQRFIGFLSFALNYKIHRLDVTGFHIVNLLIHILNALLVYFLVILSFKTPFLHSTLRPYSNLIALSSALLFACHPLQTQAVTYIVQRLASLATLFYLLSLVLYIKARLASTAVSTSSSLPTSALTLTWYFLSLISAVLAMKTKEMTFTLPVTIALYEFMFFKEKISKRIIYLIPILLTLLIIPLSLIGIDKPLGDLIGDVSEATRIQTSMSRLDYLFTEFRVIVTYIRLIFLPINQNLDYDYPTFHSFFNPEVLLSFLLLALIFGSGVYVAYRSRGSVAHRRLIAFGIFWFFITLSVESSIIPLHVIYEHRVYLPSIGVFIALSTVVFISIEKIRDRWKGIEYAVFAALFVVIMILSGATFARNIVWKDAVSLWEDVVRKSPNKVRAHNNLGVAYKSQGLTDHAIEHFQIATKLKPDYSQAYNNLGTVYQAQGLITKAIQQFKTAIKYKPDYSHAYHNLGFSYYSQGLIDRAIEQYNIAIRLDPAYSDAHNNLGTAYQYQGHNEKAIKHFKIALKLNPDFALAHNNLGIVYQAQGLTRKAITHFKNAVILNPGSPDTYYQLGNIYLSQHLFHEAIEQFRIAVKLNPDHTNAHFNLGYAFKAINITEKAIHHYQIAIQLNPNLPDAHFNLANAYLSLYIIEDAIEHYQSAIQLKPDWEKPHYSLGLIYFEQGNHDKARKEFETVLKINPSHAQAQKLIDTITQ